MVYLQQKYTNHTLKEGTMESTTNETTAVENAVHHLTQQNLALDTKVKSIKFQLNGLREIINGLPWEDINTGEFSPAAGCSDVTDARDAFITFGCCSETLSKGLAKSYKVTYTVPLTVTISIGEAVCEEDAERQADDLLDQLEVEYMDELDEWDIDSSFAVADNVIEQ